MSIELEQMCALAKTQRGMACAHLIVKAIGHKNIFCFGELLQLPSIEALQSQSEFSAHHRTLELFAYGVYSDYTSDRSSYLDLSDSQVTKLKQLSLVTLATRSESVNLTYADLMLALGMNNACDLEDLIVQTVYLGLVDGKLNQKEGFFRVKEYAARDVRQSDIDDMIAVLTAWSTSISTLQQSIVDDAVTVQRALQEGRTEQLELNADVVSTVKSLKENRTDGGMGGFMMKRGNTSLKRSRNAGTGV